MRIVSRLHWFALCFFFFSTLVSEQSSRWRSGEKTRRWTKKKWEQNESQRWSWGRKEEVGRGVRGRRDRYVWSVGDWLAWIIPEILTQPASSSSIVLTALRSFFISPNPTYTLSRLHFTSLLLFVSLFTSISFPSSSLSLLCCLLFPDVLSLTFLSLPSSICVYTLTATQAASFKGALCSFGEEIQNQDINVYNMNEVITWIQGCIFFHN